jgi:hypothetical protein
VLCCTSCDAQGFKDKEAGKSEALLMEAVESYFISGVTDPAQRIRATNLPPIYFQHAGEYRRISPCIPLPISSLVAQVN